MPRRGMGVEIDVGDLISGSGAVMPRRGMGVEITMYSRRLILACVMPRRGMGVEIEGKPVTNDHPPESCPAGAWE